MGKELENEEKINYNALKQVFTSGTSSLYAYFQLNLTNNNFKWQTYVLLYKIRPTFSYPAFYLVTL